MKKMMLMLAVLGCSVGSYAQKIVYKCPAGTAHKKTIVKHTRAKATATRTYIARPATSWTGLVSCAPDTTCTDMMVSSDTAFGGYRTDVALRPLSARSLQVTSNAFTDRGEMPSKYTCDGQQVSPPLDIANMPEGTQSLAVVMTDAQAGNRTHWLMWNVDTTGSIPENFINDNTAFNASNQQFGYNAACPVGGAHDYHFQVYALDTKLKLNRRTADRAALERAMRGHVLAKGELVGTYAR